MKRMSLIALTIALSPITWAEGTTKIRSFDVYNKIFHDRVLSECTKAGITASDMSQMTLHLDGYVPRAVIDCADLASMASSDDLREQELRSAFDLFNSGEISKSQFQKNLKSSESEVKSIEVLGDAEFSIDYGRLYCEDDLCTDRPAIDTKIVALIGRAEISLMSLTMKQYAEE